MFLAPRALRSLSAAPAAGVVAAFLIALIVCGALLSPRFATLGNALTVLEQAAPLGFVAIGQTLVVLAGGIDLSIGAIAAAATVALAGAVDGRDAWMAPTIAIVLAACGGVGFINGALIAATRVHPLIVTLGSASALNGLVLLYTLQPTGRTPAWFESFAYGRLFGLPVAALAMFVVCVLAAGFLRLTSFGRSVYATGGNPEAARLSGIRVERVTVFVYTVSGMLAGLAGLYFVSRMGVGDPRVGESLTLASIAPVVVGGTLLGGGRGGVAGALLGVLLISVLNNLLNYIHVSTFIQWVVQGVIIMAAVSAFSRGGKRI
jgi:ribose/xylose/arabinose/galactoside ABC-type transport system permease subunit